MRDFDIFVLKLNCFSSKSPRYKVPLLSYLRHNLVFWGVPLLFFPLRQGLCGVLNENSPHRLIYLDVWSSFGGTVWAGLGSEALLEEVGHWGGLCGVQNVSFQIAPSASRLWLRCKLTATAVVAHLSAYCCSPVHDGHGL